MNWCLTNEATPELLNKVFELVMRGGQIGLAEDILKKNIANSEAIIYWTPKVFVGYMDIIRNPETVENIKAITVVKNPQKSYKRKVFEKTGWPGAQDDFDFEIGYCFTDPEFQGKGVCKELIRSITDVWMPDNTFFATTKNPAMMKLFTNIEWEEFGNSYPVSEEDKTLIAVYTHQPK